MAVGALGVSGTIDFQQKGLVSLSKCIDRVTIVCSLLFFLPDDLLLSLMHRSIIISISFIVLVAVFGIFSVTYCRVTHMQPCRANGPALMHTIPFRIRFRLCERDWWLREFTQKHWQTKSDKIIKSPVAISYRWTHIAQPEHRFLNRSEQKVSRMSVHYLVAVHLPIWKFKWMNECECATDVRVCSLWCLMCLQFILINVGCIEKATQGTNTNNNEEGRT